MSSTVRFNNEVTFVASTYKLSSSLKQRAWYCHKEIKTIKKECPTYSEEKKRVRSHRQNFVQSVLAQQEEASEELGTYDTKGLYMFASTLSKPDTKKALQKARLDSLDAYEIHCQCGSCCASKTVDEYSKRTCIPRSGSRCSVKSSSRRAAPARHTLLPITA